MEHTIKRMAEWLKWRKQTLEKEEHLNPFQKMTEAMFVQDIEALITFCQKHQQSKEKLN